MASGMPHAVTPVGLVLAPTGCGIWFRPGTFRALSCSWFSAGFRFLCCQLSAAMTALRFLRGNTRIRFIMARYQQLDGTATARRYKVLVSLRIRRERAPPVRCQRTNHTARRSVCSASYTLVCGARCAGRADNRAATLSVCAVIKGS